MKPEMSNPLVTKSVVFDDGTEGLGPNTGDVERRPEGVDRRIVWFWIPEPGRGG
jgi:hypothetical protein